MEKVFSWKVLVSFCAIFIISWVALQIVSNMRLEEEAELIGDAVFNWDWPDTLASAKEGENALEGSTEQDPAHRPRGLQSRGQMNQAQILKKSDNDAVIKVSGKQIITMQEPGQSLDNSSPKSETVDCSVVLTLYKMSGKWVLGRVEL